MYKQVLQGQDPHNVQLMLALFSNLAKVEMAKKLPFINVPSVTQAETVLDFILGCVNDILVK